MASLPEGTIKAQNKLNAPKAKEATKKAQKAPAA